MSWSVSDSSSLEWNASSQAPTVVVLADGQATTEYIVEYAYTYTAEGASTSSSITAAEVVEPGTYTVAVTIEDGTGNAVAELGDTISFTITKASVDVEWSGDFEVYYTGDGIAPADYVSAKVSLPYESEETVLPADVSSDDTIEDAGTYTLTASVTLTEEQEKHYSIGNTTHSFEVVSKHQIVITADNLTFYYGETADITESSYAITVDGTETDADTAGIQVTLIDKGTTIGVQYSFAAGSAYSEESADVTVTEGTITQNVPLPITVTIADAEKTYEEDDPEYSWTVALNLPDGESYSGYTLDKITKELSDILNVTRDGGEDVKEGGYSIYLENTEKASNYAITESKGTLTINPITITLKADNAEKYYGESDT